MRRGGAWELGWWAPVPPALEPGELVDPGVHGALLSAVADGAPLDRLGQHRLESLKAAGLATPDGRPRFPVAQAAQAKAVAETAGDLGRAMARLVAGEWSRLEVEYESVHAALASPARARPPSWSSAGCCSTSGCAGCCAARAWPRRPSAAPSSGWPRARAPPAAGSPGSPACPAGAA